MLRVMRDSFHRLKWVLLAVVAAFIFGFVFIDMGLGGATSAGGDEQAFAARVNGETITFREYNRALYYTEQSYRQIYGQQLTPDMIETMGLPKQVLDSLIEQRLLLQEARRLNLEASPEEVRKRILEIPTLNPDGKFVGAELYSRYVTGQLGYMSAAEFEEEIAREITLRKIESALGSATLVSKKAAETEYRRSAESSKIRYIYLPAARVANVTVTPAEVEAFYRANQAKYAHGEQRNVKYLLADFNRLRSLVIPTEQQLRARYEANRAMYERPESARIQHILIKVDPSAAAADDAAAREKAQSIVQQLRAGADFGALARQHSGDPSSAGNGGDMGWVDKGMTVPAFENAAFSTPLNTISDPIRTPEYGYHIIKVLERRQGGVRPFEEVRTELSAQMADEIAKEQATDAINTISARIRQKPPATAEEFAANANDKVTSMDTQWFAKGEPVPGLGNHPQLSAWAFTAKQGEVGRPLGTPRGIVLPYLSGVRPAGVSSLADVRQRIENDARTAKGREAARAQLAAATAGASSVDAVAAKAGLSVAETTVSREAPITGIAGDTSALAKAVVSAPVGALQGPMSAGDGAVVFQVTEQKKISPEELATAVAQYSDTMRAQQARSLRAALLQRLREKADVDVNNQAIESGQRQDA